MTRMLRDITESEWKDIQERRNQLEEFQKNLDELVPQMRDAMKDVPLQVLEYNNAYRERTKTNEVLFAALQIEIFRRHGWKIPEKYV